MTQDEMERPMLPFNQKPTTVSLFGSLGGGDYPFGGLGIKLQRRVFNDNWIAGVSAEYIGSTAPGIHPGPDPVQVFPIMADLRYKFTSTHDNRFSTHIGLQAGYIISITQNGMDEYGPYQYHHGFGLMPVISFKFNVFKDAGVFADLGWLHQRHRREYFGSLHSYPSKVWNQAVIRAGIFF